MCASFCILRWWYGYAEYSEYSDGKCILAFSFRLLWPFFSGSGWPFFSGPRVALFTRPEHQHTQTHFRQNCHRDYLFNQACHLTPCSSRLPIFSFICRFCPHISWTYNDVTAKFEWPSCELISSISAPSLKAREAKLCLSLCGLNPIPWSPAFARYFSTMRSTCLREILLPWFDRNSACSLSLPVTAGNQIIIQCCHALTVDGILSALSACLFLLLQPFFLCSRTARYDILIIRRGGE